MEQALIALILFIVGGLVGLYAALSYFFKGILPPLSYLIAHGVFQAPAFIIVILGYIQGVITGFWGTAVIVLAALAALDGLFIAYNHLRGSNPPKEALYAHAILGILVVLILLGFVLGIV